MTSHRAQQTVATPARVAVALRALVPVVALLATSQLAAVTPEPPGRKTHPRLVSLATTSCTTCHQKVLAGRPNRHAAVADCTSCHKLELSEHGTSVALEVPEPALCLKCHGGLGQAAMGQLKAAHEPVTRSCVSCHDPHASAEPRLLSAPLRQLCAKCHPLAALQQSHGGQLVETTNCTSCHVAHGSDNVGMLVASRSHAPFADKTCGACHRPPLGGRVRLKSRGEALCTACHSDVVKAPSAGSRHAPLTGTRGRAGCLSCHGPHVSGSPGLLLKSGPELCATCHAEIVQAARDKTGHAAAAEGCDTCHKPHTAPLPHLLSERSPALCGSCHDLADATLVRAHLGADLRGKDCLTCHTPHGSGNAKLLAKNVHAAIAGGCGTCHRSAAGKLVDNGESALCARCHDDIGKRAEAAKFPHAAVVAGKCTDCHNPHASAQAKLVKAGGGGPCLDCHAAQGPQAGEVAHGVIEMLGCAACHEPHGSDNPKLLRAVGRDLCLSCHGPSAVKWKQGDATVKLAGRFEVPATQARAIRAIRMSPDGKRGHPTPEHPLTGAPDAHKSRVQVNFTGELSCLSCHDPHKGKTVELLKGGAMTATEVCLQCHTK